MSYLETLIAFVGVILLASLLVTIINQLFVWFFDLRGKNLFWGLKLLFKSFDTGAEDEIKKVVRKILKHPMIASSKHRLSSVIRRDQLALLIDHHSDFFKVEGKEGDVWKKLQTKKKEICNWFDTVSDRMSERFHAISRYFSIIAAVIIALMFQIDSIYMFQRIHNDEALKAQMVAGTEMIMQQADNILAETPVFDQAMDSLRNAIKPLELPASPSLSNERIAKAWLGQQTLEGMTKEELSNRYDKVLQFFIQEKFEFLSGQFMDIQDKLAPKSSKILTATYGWNKQDWNPLKFLGVLLSMILISLGAPFWFNTLKNLTGLRNRVMASEEKERATRQEERAGK